MRRNGAGGKEEDHGIYVPNIIEINDLEEYNIMLNTVRSGRPENHEGVDIIELEWRTDGPRYTEESPADLP